MRTRILFLTVSCFVALLVLAGCSGSENEGPSPTAAPVVEAAPTEAPEATAAPATTVEPDPTAAPTATDEPEPTIPPTPTTDPAAAVVLNYAALVNAGDYAAAADLFAEDAMIYFLGMPPVGMEIYRGSEQYQAFLEECCTGQHFEMEVSVDRVEAGVVYAEGKTWMDFTRELGVAPNSFQEVFVVRDGKIALYTSTMTEEALANFKPPMREIMPDLFELPPPGDEAPVSEISITFADGTCAYDGPMKLQAGELTVNVDVQDDTWSKYAVSFFTLDDDKDLLDLMASTSRPNPPPWSNMVYLREFDPGESLPFTIEAVEEGMLYLVCWAGTPDSAIGNAGPFYVEP